MNVDSELVVCFVTAPEANADELARVVVGGGLAACVNVLAGVRSVFRWQDRLEEAEECLLVLKTTRNALEGLRAVLTQTHPYENFELIALPIVDGAPAYLRWLAESVPGATRGGA